MRDGLPGRRPDDGEALKRGLAPSPTDAALARTASGEVPVPFSTLRSAPILPSVVKSRSHAEPVPFSTPGVVASAPCGRRRSCRRFCRSCTTGLAMLIRSARPGARFRPAGCRWPRWSEVVTPRLAICAGRCAAERQTIRRCGRVCAIGGALAPAGGFRCLRLTRWLGWCARHTSPGGWSSLAMRVRPPGGRENGEEKRCSLASRGWKPPGNGRTPSGRPADAHAHLPLAARASSVALLQPRTRRLTLEAIPQPDICGIRTMLHADIHG